MHHMVLMASAATSTADGMPQAPWWIKVLAGMFVIIVGLVLAMLVHHDKITLGDLLDEHVGWVVLVIFVAGFCLMLWGLGVNMAEALS